MIIHLNEFVHGSVGIVRFARVQTGDGTGVVIQGLGV
jgi:hypothetical protein